jgi:heme-degrading monooxygenase HmoA
MVVRTWTAVARSPGDADAYAEHLRSTVFPHLRTIDGHLGAYLLQRASATSVAVMVMTVWESRDAIRAFSGDDTGVAVVEPEARRLLVNFDERVAIYDVVLDSFSHDFLEDEPAGA